MHIELEPTDVLDRAAVHRVTEVSSQPCAVTSGAMVGDGGVDKRISMNGAWPARPASGFGSVVCAVRPKARSITDDNLDELGMAGVGGRRFRGRALARLAASTPAPVLVEIAVGDPESQKLGRRNPRPTRHDRRLECADRLAPRWSRRRLVAGPSVGQHPGVGRRHRGGRHGHR